MSSTPHTKTLPNGMTPRQAIRHKLRGLADVCLSLEDLYPKTFSSTATVILVGLTILSYTHFFTKTRELALRGAELDHANATYSLIQTADAMSEDFLTPTIQADAFAKADVEFAKMQATAKTDRGRYAAKVFGYYLDSVKKLPAKDVECALVKMATHRAENDFDEDRIGEPAMVEKEVDYFRCQAERTVIRGAIASCRQEAFTLVTGTNQSPVPTCIFRHESPSAMQR